MNSNLSTLERAKRFEEQIERWTQQGIDMGQAWRISYGQDCKVRAYRALLKKEIGRMVKTSSDFHPLRRKGFIEGLEAALELFDVIHGRKEK